jgi:DEAD/DEAH box helicase domain-containing protein
MSKLPTRIKLNTTYWKHTSGVPFSEDVIPSSLFLRHKDYLVFDLETKNLIQEVGGWNHLNKLQVSIACAYDSKTDSWLTFHEQDLRSLIRLCYERLVIGYNIRGFDLPILAAYGLDIKHVDAFDIMYDLQAQTRQRYLKLEAVARGTLKVGKSADGLLAVEWWKTGQIDKIIEYCLQDVKVTRDIFEYGRRHGEVQILRSETEGTLVSVPVQWN